MTTAHGRFPFGRPNTERPLRHAASGRAKALVVGVYPSAFHVAWSIPPEVDDRPQDKRRHPYVASFAVDVEPTVFWDGKTPSPQELLERWKAEVNFRPSWGTVRAGHNGPSGAGLLAEYLDPLRIQPSDVAMTDAVPWFFIKTGAGSQGDAVERLKAFNKKLPSDLRANEGSLPERPSPKVLVELANTEPRRSALRRELLEAGAELVITLGQEALDAVRSVSDKVACVQTKLAPDAEYGKEGTLTVDSYELRLRPLVHPGLLRQSASAGENGGGAKGSSWRAAHDRWSASHGR